MAFNSINFIIFFPVVAFVYFLLPHAVRWVWLLAASCCFYFFSSTPWHLLLLIGVIAAEYGIGIALGADRVKGDVRRGLLLAAGVALPLSVLIIFKYVDFFSGTIVRCARFLDLNYPAPVLNLILPVGISYYAFLVIGYVVDVYRGNIAPVRHPGIFSLYVLFFPKIIAGPIERPGNLVPQLYEEHAFDPGSALDGLKMMAWGFFKKLVVADRLAVPVNEIFNNPGDYSGLHYMLAAFFFTVQIYADFSGYTDIALGAARVMGFRLTDNFRTPYHADSIADFWKRWHITLSAWFRDYVYIPLGGSRVSAPRRYGNLFLTFAASGLWHGASWTFIAWGALHGAYVVLGLSTRPLREQCVRLLRLDRAPRLYRAIRMFVTFMLVSFAWIFFRANSLSDACRMAAGVFYSAGDALLKIITLDFGHIAAPSAVRDITRILGFDRRLYSAEITLSVLGIIVMEVVDILRNNDDCAAMIAKKSPPVRWIAYILVVMGVLLFGVWSNSTFIYFRF